jgi:hypothetical protein
MRVPGRYLPSYMTGYMPLVFSRGPTFSGNDTQNIPMPMHDS